MLAHAGGGASHARVRLGPEEGVVAPCLLSCLLSWSDLVVCMCAWLSVLQSASCTPDSLQLVLISWLQLSAWGVAGGGMRMA